MVGQLPGGTIKTGHRLVAVKDNGNLTYTLTFSVGASSVQVVADHVVLALPFSTLRQVDLTRTNLSPLKRRAINELQLGTNAKITLQVAGRPWNAAGYTGNTLTDLRLSAEVRRPDPPSASMAAGIPRTTSPARPASSPTSSVATTERRSPRSMA